MIDERDDEEKSREIQGAKPGGHATFEEPTGADVVVAKEEGTITDGGLVTPAHDTIEPA